MSAIRAYKEIASIKRVFSWAYEYEYEYEKVKFNPTSRVKNLTVKARQDYAEDQDYQFMLYVARASIY